MNELKDELDQADRYSFMEGLILAESGQNMNDDSLREMGMSQSNILSIFPQNDLKIGPDESFLKINEKN